MDMDFQPTDINSPRRVWATLITNTAYLPGLLTLEYSLRRVGSQYPLVALYTDTLPPEGQRALDRRAIPKVRVDYLVPQHHGDYSADPRFYDTWSKLAVFGLVQFHRVVLLDADMLVVRNMDELMEMELDSDDGAGVDLNVSLVGRRLFAACYACLCNPLKKGHYPADWIPENCPYTLQHLDPDAAQTEGPPSPVRPTMPNSGLVVLNPSIVIYGNITQALQDPKTRTYVFPDQALLGDVFAGRWVTLPYVYNALKTLQWKGVHHEIWRDDKIKNIHYGLTPKPWEVEGPSEEALVRRWQDVNQERLQEEHGRF